MKIKLNKKLVQRMMSQPESGMGYQKVEVVLKNGQRIEGLVHCSEILDINSSLDISDIQDIEVVN